MSLETMEVLLTKYRSLKQLHKREEAIPILPFDSKVENKHTSFIFWALIYVSL